MIPVGSISGQLFFSTVRLVATKADGTSSVGTGFYFNVSLDAEGKNTALVIVTNKHVIDGAVSGEFVLHEATDATLNQPAGRTATVRVAQNFEDAWLRHPNPEVDLCMMFASGLIQSLANHQRHLFFRAFRDLDIPSLKTLEGLRGIEDVTMIGYPSGIWDHVHNLPVARRGVTASHPALRFTGKPIGLADIGSYQGSSGSPVIVLNEGSYSDGQGLVLSNRVLLLGVMFALAQYTTPGEIKITNIPTTAADGVVTRIPMHLSIYVQASELLAMKPMIEAAVLSNLSFNVQFNMLLRT